MSSLHEHEDHTAAELRSDTLSQALVRAAALTPTAGLRFLDRRERETFRTWPQVVEDAERVGGALTKLGVQPGERVALLFPTEPDFFAAFFGAIFAGAVPVPLYPPVRLGRLEEYHRRTAAMLTAASARVVLAAPKVQRVLGETLRLARPPLGCYAISELPHAPAGPVELEPEALAMVQFSSGTTVAPKPVALSHRAVVAQARLIEDKIIHRWPEETEHCGVSWLPLYHDMGLIGCVFPALLHPSTLTLIGPEVFVTRPATWLRALSRYRGTVSPAPNFAYALCVDRIRDEQLEGVDLSRWAVALNGAEPVAPATLRRFVERFSRWGLRPEALTPVYGLSEASLAVTFSELRRPFTTQHFDREALSHGRAEAAAEGVELATVGEPLPGFELSLRDAGRRPLPDGRVGRLWIRGPSLMEGYLDRPEATAAVFDEEGWLDTGDLGFVHEGELYLTGRAKDLLVLRGRNYAPQDIELAVDAVPGVRTGCAAAASWRPEGADMESLAVFVEHRADAAPEEIEAMPKRCAEAVREAVGLSCELVVALEPGTLPRTSSGKIRRAEALRRYLDEELAPPKKVTPIYLAGVLARSWLAGRRR
jgi:fatty-acyl-CoA synthase